MGMCRLSQGNVHQLLRGGPVGLAGDRQGDHVQGQACGGAYRPSPNQQCQNLRRHQQEGRSAAGAQLPGEKTAEGIARGCNRDMISTPMP